jgi:hypothetical protein
MTLEVTYLVWGLVVGYFVGAPQGFFLARGKLEADARRRELALIERLVPADAKKLMPYQNPDLGDNSVGVAKVRAKEQPLT